MSLRVKKRNKVSEKLYSHLLNRTVIFLVVADIIILALVAYLIWYV